MAVADELCQAEREGEGAGRQTAHREHEGEPAGVGMRALVTDAAERSHGEHRGEDAGGEDGYAGSQNLACVLAHGGSKGLAQRRTTACRKYTKTPLTET